MRLFAALVPPRDVLDHVARVVAAVQPEPEPPAESGHPGRHAATTGKRFGRRRGAGTGPEKPPAPQLDPVPVVRMHVPIAKFGNVALADANRLSEAMVEQASGWGSPRLRVQGGLALEPEGDTSVWARLAGDLDELKDVVSGISRVAQGLHLLVDRRMFRPDVQLATINARTTEPYLEQVLAALDALETQAWWQASISLLVPADLGPDKPPYRDYRDVPLGPAVPH